MFYSQSLLSRKGPLGNIWIAAFCFRKLKKEQIAGTDITSSIDKIMPDVQISYRVLAQLLLGIVRIFSKKVDYLYHDCNEALAKIRKSFTPVQRIVRRKTTGGQQQAVVVVKDIDHELQQNVTASKEGTPVMHIEAMCAPYHDLTISMPEHFELDAFDLQFSDDGCTAKSHELPLPEGLQIDERDQDSFLNESYHREVDVHSDYCPARFSPVDVIPLHMMNIDLEVGEIYNSSSFEERWHKTQEYFMHLEQSENQESLGHRNSSGPYLHEEDQFHPVRMKEDLLSDIDKRMEIEERNSPDNEQHHVLTEGHLDATAQAKTVVKVNSPCDPGIPSPKFAVTTPAKKERPRMTRKRKNLLDETIVLSNEILRMWIHDASALVCKRRKAPHTFLDAWKASKITNLHEKFMEPLIPGTSSEFKAFNYSPLKKCAGFGLEIVNTEKKIPHRSSCVDNLLQKETLADTFTPANHSGVPTQDKSYEERIGESFSVGTSVSGLDIMDKDLGAHEDNSDQGDGWSLRTRAVARYLCSKFLDLKEQRRNEILSLAQILEGQTRQRCAKFFYETLVLKGHDCIDVRQDLPYDDVNISATSQLQALFKSQ